MDEFEKNEMSFDDELQKTETLSDDIAEETETADAATDAETIDETFGAETADETEADEAEALAAAEPDVQKKKPVLQRTIKIAICIFLAAGIIFGGAMLAKYLFTNSVVGTWVIDTGATPDEAGSDEDVQYFTFNEDGTASLSGGSIKVSGTWNYTDKDQNKSDTPTDSITASIYVYFAGNFNVTLDGNAFSGRTMVLKGDGGAEYKFKSATQPKIDVEPSKDFKAVDGVTGTWSAEINGGKMTYAFNEDGTLEYNVKDSTSNNEILSLSGAYTVDTKKKTISVIYYTDSKKTENKMELTYSFDKKTKGKKLKISEQEFSIVEK